MGFYLKNIRFLDRIVKKKDMDMFEKKIKNHHKAKISDNLNVLSRAVIEHNIVAVSKIYETISIASLAKILQIEENLVFLFFL